MPAGQPTKYRPEYCELLIQHGVEGGTLESFGPKIGVHRGTLYNWCENIPEFLDARKKSMDACQSFLENVGKAGLTGQLTRVKTVRTVTHLNGDVERFEDREPTQMNAAIWIFYMKNVAGWRDKKDIEMSGKGGGPIQYADMTDEEIDKRIKQLDSEIAAAEVRANRIKKGQKV